MPSSCAGTPPSSQDVQPGLVTILENAENGFYPALPPVIDDDDQKEVLADDKKINFYKQEVRAFSYRRVEENEDGRAEGCILDQNAVDKMVLNDVRGFLTHALRDNGEPFFAFNVDLIIDNEVELLKLEKPGLCKTEDAYKSTAAKNIHLKWEDIEDKDEGIWPQFLGDYAVELRQNHIVRFLKLGLQSLSPEKRNSKVEQFVREQVNFVTQTPKEQRGEVYHNMIRNCAKKHEPQSEETLCQTMAIRSMTDIISNWYFRTRRHRTIQEYVQDEMDEDLLRRQIQHFMKNLDIDIKITDIDRKLRKMNKKQLSEVSQELQGIDAELRSAVATVN